MKFWLHDKSGSYVVSGESAYHAAREYVRSRPCRYGAGDFRVRDVDVDVRKTYSYGVVDSEDGLDLEYYSVADPPGETGEWTNEEMSLEYETAHCVLLMSSHLALYDGELLTEEATPEALRELSSLAAKLADLRDRRGHSALAAIREEHGVPAKVGMRVKSGSGFGTIVSCTANFVRVEFDNPGRYKSLACFPQTLTYFDDGGTVIWSPKEERSVL